MPATKKTSYAQQLRVGQKSALLDLLAAGKKELLERKEEGNEEGED